MDEKDSITDFVMLPRKIRNEYSEGKLTKNEFDVLIWIWLNANPVNGLFNTSYEGLRQDLRDTFSNDSARKIISSLRKAQYIYFVNHKGRGGSFPVYPVGFRRTKGIIQDWDYLNNKNPITTQPATQTQKESIPKHNSGVPNHKFEELKRALIKSHLPMRRDTFKV